MRAWYWFIVLILLAASMAAHADPQIDGGEGYTCALGKSGRAFCWGANTSGQTGSGLGMPAQSSVSRPTEMAGGFVTIANGGQHSCGLQADGSAYCWGDNYFGQVGNGVANATRVSLPVRVQTNVRFKSITVGGAHTCALDEDNFAWCWGSNSNSQLGQAPLSPSGLSGTLFATTPKLVLPPTTFGAVLEFQSLSAGSAYTCGIDLSGAAWCWGSNINGRAGIDISQCGGPVAISCDFIRPALTVASGGGVLTSGLFNLRFTSISAGELNTCAIDTGGGVQCWGPHFLRGRSFTGVVDRPSVVTALLNSAAVSVSAGGRSVCAVTSTGELFCWGNHDHGQLGDGSPIAPGATSLTPVRVAGPQDYAAVSVGTAHACARTLAGSARCWGINDSGQLGIGGLGGSEQNVPMTVVGLQTTLISSGGRHVCSLDAVDVVACWGSNLYGQIGHGLTADAAPTRSVVPTPVARFYGIRRTPFSPPTSSPPEQLSNTMPQLKLVMATVEFTRLSVGGQHACALNGSGNAYCWGVDRVGQVGNGNRNLVACRYEEGIPEGTPPECVPYPTIVSRDDRHVFVDISAGAAHNCGRNASGIVSCWGSARYGELGSTTTATFLRVPTQIEVPFPYRIQMLDVSAGEASSCAVNGSDMFCWGAITGTGTPQPMKVPSGPNYVRVGTGALHACTSFPNMALMCIGNNSFGELGDGTNTPSWTGTQVWAGTPLVSYSLSWGSACGADVLAGGVLCWGFNGSGQLGDGTTFDANVPQNTLTPPGFIATTVGTGFDHACAIDGSGAAQCWGGNTAAQLGDGRVESKPVTVPVAVAAGWNVP